MNSCYTHTRGWFLSMHARLRVVIYVSFQLRYLWKSINNFGNENFEFWHLDVALNEALTGPQSRWSIDP